MEKSFNKILYKDPNLHVLFQDHPQKKNKNMEEEIKRRKNNKRKHWEIAKTKEANYKNGMKNLKSFRYHKNYQNRSI